VAVTKAGRGNLVAGTAPDGRSLTPQDKGSLGKKQKLPGLVVSVTAAGKIRAERLGKRKKLRVFVVTVTPAVSMSMERFGKKKSFPIMWCQ
jgi:hypothetical protein